MLNRSTGRAALPHPVTVEVTRGGRVESMHRGSAAIVDGDGRVLFALGDIDAPVYPRSASKAMQALPLIESGAADALGLTDRELALACSSHSGEDEHVATAASMLTKAGLDHSALECGAHWSFDQRTLIHQARTLDAPSALHNNCSGKHAAMLCTAAHLGIDPRGYIDFDHPVQVEIRNVMEALTGATLNRENCGPDGCSIPTYAVPLKSLAHGFAKMVTGTGLTPERARASQRLIRACMAEPFFVAGTGRACTALMQLAPGRIFAKTGAEGVFVAALPEHGVAIALSCDDGTTRAAEAMVAGLIARCLGESDPVYEALLSLANHPLHNWNGIHVGDIRVTDALFA